MSADQLPAGFANGLIGALTVTALLIIGACGNEVVSSTTLPFSTTVTLSAGSTSQPEETTSSPQSTSTSLAELVPEMTIVEFVRAHQLQRPTASELPPAEWAGVRKEADSLIVGIAGAGEREQVIAVLPGGDAAEDGLYELGGTDFSLDPATVSVAMCCEPASGSIVVLKRADGSELLGDQGVKTDQFGGVMARVDGSGFSVVWKEWGPRDGLVAVAGLEYAQDIALLSTDDPPAVAILRHVSQGWLITLWAGQPLGNLHLPGDGWCGIVGLAGGYLGLLADRQSTSCQSANELWVLSDDAETEPQTIMLEGGAVTANSDASGTYVIYSTKDGAVRWVSVDGRRGELANPDGYEAVDW